VAEGEERRSYSQQELDEIIQRRLNDTARENVLKELGSRIKVVEAKVDDFLADRLINARNIASQLGVVILSPDERKVFDVMLEKEQNRIRRGEWWQTTLGRTALLVGLFASLAVIATFVLTAYIAFADLSHVSGK